jgi:hypothetical protein
MFAPKWTILAVDILDVNFKLGSGCEGRRTLIAMVVFDLEMTLQMLFDMLLLECPQTADIAFESLLFEMHSLIMSSQI